MIHVVFYNLSVKVETDDRGFIIEVERFVNKYYTIKASTYGLQQPSVKQQPDKKFYSRISGDAVFYLHTNQFRHLLEYLKAQSFQLRDVTKEDCRNYIIDRMDYQVRDKWVLKEKQAEAVKFILDNPVRSKMISIVTGGGKTVTSLYALAKLQYKMAVVILPTYIEKWVGDIANVHEAQTKDVMVVQGSKALRGLVAMANEGTLTSKYFIFSSRTMQEYVAAYEDNPEDCVNLYGCAPIDLFPKLKLGVLLIDETHQHFHAIYKILIHTNVEFQLGLSATLLSDDNVVSRMHKTIYHDDCIFSVEITDKYTDVYALRYSIPAGYLKQVRTSTFGSNTYSHTAFEQSVMKCLPMKNLYYKIISNIVTDFYVERYEKDDKCLIFVGTVKMATELTQMYQAKYPALKVRRYCEQDPFDNLNEADLIITTVISAGTAVDIANLRVVVQTVCISSSVANIQTLGRLRKLSGDRDTRFCYIYADNLNKQRSYHNRRVELFSNRVANHKFLTARYS